MQAQEEPGSIMRNILQVTCSACLDVATFDQPTHCLFVCLCLHDDIHRYLLSSVPSGRTYLAHHEVESIVIIIIMIIIYYYY